jgi:hypothetical protein
MSLIGHLRFDYEVLSVWKKDRSENRYRSFFCSNLRFVVWMLVLNYIEDFGSRMFATLFVADKRQKS